MLTDEMAEREEQFEHLKKLNARLTAGDGPDIVEIRELEKRASQDLGELSEVHDDTTDVCDHIYKLKVQRLHQQYIATGIHCYLYLIVQF